MKRQKRDMQAMEKTRAYFLQRDGLPTSIKQAARALKVPATRLHTRVTELAKQGVLTRIDRGVYVSGPPAAKVVDTNEQLLASLLKEREHLDAQIEKVRDVIELGKKRAK